MGRFHNTITDTIRWLERSNFCVYHGSSPVVGKRLPAFLQRVVVVQHGFYAEALRAHLRFLATVAGLGTISCSSDIVRFVQGGVVKTFRYTPKESVRSLALYSYNIQMDLTTRCSRVSTRNAASGLPN